LGLNRRLDNMSNTIAAAKFAKRHMNNLYAIELGNEPNCELPLNPIQSAVADELNGIFAQFSPVAIPSPMGHPGPRQPTTPPKCSGKMPYAGICLHPTLSRLVFILEPHP
jgi:hypothetical protein